MVWCCAPFDGLNPEDCITGQKRGDGAYPGQRRQFARANGNALVAALPVSGGHEGEDLVSGKLHGFFFEARS
jgi:hypothetical protein